MKVIPQLISQLKLRIDGGGNQKDEDYSDENRTESVQSSKMRFKEQEQP